MLFYLAILIFTFVSARKTSLALHTTDPLISSGGFHHIDVMTISRHFYGSIFMIRSNHEPLESSIKNSRGSTWSGDLLKTIIYPSFNTMGISKVRKLKIIDPKESCYRHNVNVKIVARWQMRRSKIWTKTSMIFS